MSKKVFRMKGKQREEILNKNGMRENDFKKEISKMKEKRKRQEEWLQNAQRREIEFRMKRTLER